MEHLIRLTQITLEGGTLRIKEIKGFKEQLNGWINSKVDRRKLLIELGEQESWQTWEWISY